MVRPLAAVLVAALLALGCGGGGGAGHIGRNPCGTGTACGAVPVSLAAVNAAAAPTGYLRASAPVPPDVSAWQSGGIVSGPPDELRLYVQAIAAAPAGGGDAVPLFQSADARGTPVALSGGTLDLAAALGADAFQLPAGDYDRILLLVSRVAEVTGCVSGKFRATASVSGKMSEVNPAMATAEPQHAANTYANDPIADGEVHTFCTRAGPSEVTVGTFTEDAIGSNADFESSATPVPTEIDLALGNHENLGADALRAATVTVETAGAFTVTEGGAAPLTLAVDLNRFLRYFANTRPDLQPPNPSMKAGTSYFFTTVFPFSTVLVVGDGGSVEGYALDVVGTKGDGGTELVPGWLTILRDGAGAVAGGMVMGDDDDDLTVAKGNLDPAASSLGDAGWTLTYGLGNGALQGTLTGFVVPAVGGTGDCALALTTDASWLTGFTGFHAWYTRRL